MLQGKARTEAQPTLETEERIVRGYMQVAPMVLMQVGYCVDGEYIPE
jgi:hypothetical protein